MSSLNALVCPSPESTHAGSLVVLVGWIPTNPNNENDTTRVPFSLLMGQMMGVGVSKSRCDFTIPTMGHQSALLSWVCHNHLIQSKRLLIVFPSCIGGHCVFVECFSVPFPWIHSYRKSIDTPWFNPRIYPNKKAQQPLKGHLAFCLNGADDGSTGYEIAMQLSCLRWVTSG